MGAGYHVILGDLEAAAKAFTSEAQTVQGLTGFLSPAPVRTGDPTLDTVLRDLLISIGAIHDGIVRELTAHGQALQQCHDNYSSNDADVQRLFQTIMSAYQQTTYQ